MVFQWFSPKSDTMVNNGFGPFERPRKGSQSPHNRIFSQINLMIENGDKWISQIMSKFPCHFADWRKSLNFWTFKTTICYHCKVSMVFKGTITIEWNGLGQPLGSMVFRWFWGHATIGFDGLWWLSTIGPTMEWLHTIVEVYLLYFTPTKKFIQSVHLNYPGAISFFDTRVVSDST